MNQLRSLENHLECLLYDEKRRGNLTIELAGEGPLVTELSSTSNGWKLPTC
jgi:hypothetical protein